MYQSLYRKYRPKTFDQIVGQKSIIKILKNSIVNNKISHAYLFSGPRGTGKTSTAKIFAKTVNCIHLINGQSCEKCERCIEINSGMAVDIIEIDAASNNGVDEIRELRNNIKLSCSSLKYKVYIIDEVHMLSTGAFNALLKTLEEPPEHVIFILATTDPQKVPSTIVSRCQCYNFTQIAINDIVDNLKSISKKEGLEIDDEVLAKIALYSNGGMRDALGLLEKVSLYDDNITVEQFENLCGFVTSDDITKFIDCLFSDDTKNIVNIIDNQYLSGINLITFFNQIIDRMRDALISDIDDVNKVQKNVRYINCINEACNAIKNSTNPRSIAIALIVKEMLNDVSFSSKNAQIDLKASVSNESSVSINSVDNHIISKKEISVDNTISVDYDNSKIENSSVEKSKNEIIIKNDVIINNTFASASKQKLFDLKEKWKTLNEYILDNEYGSTVSSLLDANICAVGDDSIILSFFYSSLVNRAKDMYFSFINVLNKLLNMDLNIAFITSEEWQEEKKKYIEKIKSGYQYQKSDENPIIVNNNEKKDSKSLVEADIIFGEDIVEYE